MKNNIDLVKHCEMALAEKWGYVWGTFGQVLTNSIFEQKLRQYPKGVGNYRTFIRNNWMNKRSADCVGLIKSCLWWNNGKVRYNPSMDRTADGYYKLSKRKGELSSIPETPGICVWKKGHIGVYIGNGMVIEARGTTRGVIKSPLRGNGSAGWTHWMESPFIEYIKKKEEPKVNNKVEKIKVIINGKHHNLSGYKKGGTNYISIRELSETLGYKVDWDQKTQSVILKK